MTRKLKLNLFRFELRLHLSLYQGPTLFIVFLIEPLNNNSVKPFYDKKLEYKKDRCQKQIALKTLGYPLSPL